VKKGYFMESVPQDQIVGVELIPHQIGDILGDLNEGAMIFQELLTLF
jgi:hypothetical protein